jgi:hypothetical protein
MLLLQLLKFKLLELYLLLLLLMLMLMSLLVVQVVSGTFETQLAQYSIRDNISLLLCAKRECDVADAQLESVSTLHQLDNNHNQQREPVRDH